MESDSKTQRQHLRMLGPHLGYTLIRRLQVLDDVGRTSAIGSDRVADVIWVCIVTINNMSFFARIILWDKVRGNIFAGNSGANHYLMTLMGGRTSSLPSAVNHKHKAGNVCIQTIMWQIYWCSKAARRSTSAADVGYWGQQHQTCSQPLDRCQ